MQKVLDGFFTPSFTLGSVNSDAVVSDDVFSKQTKAPPLHQGSHQLFLNDTKTRGHASVPRSDLSGRLQLMLYKALLEPLVTVPQESEEDAWLRKAVEEPPVDIATVLDSPGSIRTASTDTTSYYTAFSRMNSPAAGPSRGGSFVSTPSRAPSMPHIDLSPLPPPSFHPSFSFPRLFDHLNLDPQAEFSIEFSEKAQDLVGGFVTSVRRSSKQKAKKMEEPKDWMSSVYESTMDVRCLEDVVECWWNAVERLDLMDKEQQGGDDSTITGPISHQLELIYRLRGGSGGRTRKKSLGGETVEIGRQEDVDLQRAIQESLRPLGGGMEAGSVSLGSGSEKVTGGVESGDGMLPFVDLQPSQGSGNSKLSTGTSVDWEKEFGAGWVKDEEYLALNLEEVAVGTTPPSLGPTPLETGDVHGLAAAHMGVSALGVGPLRGEAKQQEDLDSPEGGNSPPVGDDAVVDYDLALAVEESMIGRTAAVALSEEKGESSPGFHKMVG